MPIMPGTHELGPENASLRDQDREARRRRREGGSRPGDRGHLLGGDARGRRGPGQSSLKLSADSGSMRGDRGNGRGHGTDRGGQGRDQEDPRGRGAPARPGRVQVDPGHTRRRMGSVSSVTGELSHERQPSPSRLRARASAPTGRDPGRATVKQSDWGIKPYSGLFGTLKVRDEVEVVAEGSLPTR